MTEKQPEALRLADKLNLMLGWQVCVEASAELRRLHQSEREAWRYADELEQERKRLHEEIEALRRAIAQPEKEWVGLTHKEHMEIMTGTMTTSSRMAAVEAKLKEKNNG